MQPCATVQHQDPVNLGGEQYHTVHITASAATLYELVAGHQFACMVAVLCLPFRASQ